MAIIEGQWIYHPRGEKRLGIVASRFNESIVQSLVRGALETLRGHGVEESRVDIVYVPGAYEIPLMAQQLALSQQYEGLMALGTVIRGATLHYELVAHTMASGIMRISCEHRIPIAFEVLCVDTIEQALERSGTKLGNAGHSAAMVLLEMLDVLRRVPASV